MTHSFTLALFTLTLVSLIATGPILAEDQVLAGEEAAPIKITLHPSEATTPALKYRLLPSRVDQIPGNAAVYYGKVTAQEPIFFGSKEIRDNIQRWQKASLKELVAEKASVRSGGDIDFHLDRGARCRFCDWQMPIGDIQLYSTPLPAIQGSRFFGRILAANARIDLAHKRYENAIRLFQTNYALGRLVAQSEFIVGGLVGIAICKNMNKQVMEWVQQPDTPNLYWALTTLPTPLIDMRNGVELEIHGLELSYPELESYQGVGLRSYNSPEQTHPELWQVPPSRRTAKEWKRLYHTLVLDLHELIDGHSEETKPWKTEEEMEINCQKVLPFAKRYLRKHGMDNKEIEAMPRHQTVLVFLLQSFRNSGEEIAKYYSLPYPDAKAGFEAVTQQYQKTFADVPEELRAADHMLGGIKIAKMAETKFTRDIVVLRVLEALRLHGAQNDGKLPAKLSDVTVVPLPNDPVTGKPFQYRLEGKSAFLQGPPLVHTHLNYEIAMEPK